MMRPYGRADLTFHRSPPRGQEEVQDITIDHVVVQEEDPEEDHEEDREEVDTEEELEPVARRRVDRRSPT